jgi:putative DNA primase/helicase
MSAAPNNYAEIVSNSIVKQLKEGTAPWVRKWEPGETFKPYNASTGNEYKGMNALWLMSVAEQKGFKDQRWLTFAQANSLDAHVNKGEKSTVIQYWKWSQEQNRLGDDGKPLRDEKGVPLKVIVPLEQPKLFHANVFNAEQISGLLPPIPKVIKSEAERHQEAEDLLTASKANIIYQPGNRAFYQPLLDKITLPERQQFHSPDAFYSTAFHELGHWSGHKSRLDRDLAHPFGSEGYAKEELRAEIGSLMLGDRLQIGHDPSQHVAYIGSWIKAIQNDFREIFRAASDAEKITNYVTNKMELAQTASQQVQSSEAMQEDRPIQVAFNDLNLQAAPEAAYFTKGEALEEQAKHKGHAKPEDSIENEADIPVEQLKRQEKGKEWVPPFELPEGKVRNGETHYRLKDFSSIRANDTGIYMDKLSDTAILAGLMLALETNPGNAIEAVGSLEFKEKAAELAGKHGIPVVFTDQNMNHIALKNATPTFKAGATLPKDASIPPTESERDKDVQPEQLEVMDLEAVPDSEPETDISIQAPTIQAERESDMNTSNERVYLAVPYVEKDEAKAFGALWDKAEQSWFAPPGTDLTALEPWIPKPSDHVSISSGPDPREAFAEALAESGLILTGLPTMDGQIHRVKVKGDSQGEQSGTYVGHANGRPAGYIQNFKSGEKRNWKLNSASAVLSAVDRAKLAAEAAQKRQDRSNAIEHTHLETAKAVEGHWQGGAPADNHPYLQSKDVGAHGLKIDTLGTLQLPQGDPNGQRFSATGNLLVPIRDINGKLWALQSIDDNGRKSLPKGGKKQGGHHVIGEPESSDKLLFAEGYATAATLHEITALPVVVTFDSGNMKPVAEAFKEKFPAKILILAGDDDRFNAIGKNVGREKAEEAAEAVKGFTLIPPFQKEHKGSDWNDFKQILGVPETQKMLQSALRSIEVKHQALTKMAEKAIAQIMEKEPVKEQALSLSR